MNRFLATAAITTLTLSAACGSNSTENKQAESKGGDKAADRAEKAEEFNFESPISEALGQPTSASEGTRQMERQEKEIQDCMAAEGFTYIPNSASSAIFDTFTDSGPQNEEWRSKYGYGIVVPYLDPNADLYGFQPEDTQEDPNQAIVDELSEAERRAYYIALDGYDPDAPIDAPQGGTAFGGSEMVPSDFFEPKGCRGEAFSDMPGFGGNQEVMELQQDLYETLQERIESDPRIKKLQKSWRECVSKAGFSEVKSPEDSYNYISNAATEIAPNGPPMGDGPSSGRVLTGDDAESPEFPQEGNDEPLTDDQIEQLKKLKKREIALANADNECLEKSDGQAAYEKVRIDIEKQLVEERAKDLAKLRTDGDSGGQE